MKLTKSQLKQIIQEALEAQNVPRPGGMKNPVVPKFSEYEQADMSTDQQMILLLREIADQLRMLTRYMTPAKGRSASEVEKALSKLTVAEE